MKKIIIFLLLSLGFANSTIADYQDGVNAIERGDYKTAFEIFLPLAEQGNAKAQYRLSNLYRYGSPSTQGSSWMLDQDTDKYLFWTKKAADSGILDAQHALAYYYIREQDKDKTLYWFQKTIEQGDTWGLFKLGRLHEDGSDGYLKNPKKALYWYLQYIEKSGEPTALNDVRGVMNDVASIYENKLNNPKEGLIWHKKAAALGNYWSQLSLGEKYLEGKGVIKSLKDAAYWYKQAYENPSDWGKDPNLKYQIEQTWNNNELWKYE